MNPRLNPNDWTDAEHYAAYRGKFKTPQPDRLIGFTASPKRLTPEELRSIFDPLATGPSIKDLMSGLDHAATLPVELEPGLDKAKLWDAMKAETGVTWTELHPTRESWKCSCGHEFPTRYPLDSAADLRRLVKFCPGCGHRVTRFTEWGAEDLATPAGQRDRGVR